MKIKINGIEVEQIKLTARELAELEEFLKTQEQI